MEILPLCDNTFQLFTRRTSLLHTKCAISILYNFFGSFHPFPFRNFESIHVPCQKLEAINKVCKTEEYEFHFYFCDIKHNQKQK
jgi:hypothetical protein